VSNLRKEFASLKCEVEDKNKLIVDLEKRVVETNSTLKALQLGVDCNCRGNKEATSLGSRVTSKVIDWSVAPFAGRTKKRYSDVVADRPFDNKMYKLFVKSKNSQSAEYTRTLLKSNVNPTQMEVGIGALKTLKNGQLLI